MNKKQNNSSSRIVLKSNENEFKYSQINNPVQYQSPRNRSFGTLFTLFSTKQDQHYIYKVKTKQAVFELFTFALIRKKSDKLSQIKRVVCYQNLYKIPKANQSINQVEILNLKDDQYNSILDISISQYNQEQSEFTNTFELTIFTKQQILISYYKPFKHTMHKKLKIDVGQFDIRQCCLLNGKSFICERITQSKQEVQLNYIRNQQISPIKLIATYQNAQILLKNINSFTFVIYNKTRNIFDIFDQRFDRVDRIVANSLQQQKILEYPISVNYDHTLHNYQILELPNFNRVKLFYQDQNLISKYEDRPNIPNIDFEPLDFQNALFYFKMNEHRILIKPNILFAEIRAKIASPFSPLQSYTSTPIEILGSDLIKLKRKQDLNTDFWVERVCVKWMMLKDQKRKRKLLIIQNLRNFKHQILNLNRKSTSTAHVITSPRNNTYVLVVEKELSRKNKIRNIVISKVLFWDGQTPQTITCNRVDQQMFSDDNWKVIDIFRATKGLNQIVKNINIDTQSIRFYKINDANVGVILYSNQVEYRNTIHNTHFFRKLVGDDDEQYVYYLVYVSPNSEEVVLRQIKTKLNLHLLYCSANSLDIDSIYYMQFTRKDSYSSTICNIFSTPQLRLIQSIDNIQSFLPYYHSQIVCQMTDFSSKVLTEFNIKFQLQFQASLYLFGVRHLLFPNVQKIILATPFGLDENGVPNKIPTTLKQFVNQYVYFKTRLQGMQLTTMKNQINQSILTQQSATTSKDSLNEIDMQNQVAKVFIEQYLKLQSSLSKLYLELKDSDIDMLVFYLICQNRSITQMKDKYGGDNFIISFYQLICQNKRYEFFGLFKNELDVLHSAMRNTNISLYEFYQNSIVQVEQVFKLKSKDQFNFQDSNSERSQKFSNKLGPQGNVKLEIYRSLFELPPPLSDANANFSYALSQTKDFRIFQTELIKRYVRLRWKSAFKYYLAQTIIIIVTMILLFFHASFYREIGIVVPMFVISIQNFIIEVVQMIALGMRQYLENVWNWSDIIRVLLNFAYFIILVGNFTSDQVNSAILTFIALTTFVKLTSIFSYFRETRVLLRIFIEILRDMLPFFLFIVVTTLSIAIMYTSTLTPGTLNNQSFLDNLEHAFLLDFGDFNLDGYNYLRNIVFIFSTILVPLVLLNMLIAIMGDTYDKVKEEERTRDFHEIVYLLHVYQKMARVVCKRFRNKYSWKYIYFSKIAQLDAFSNKYGEAWEGRLKSIKNKIGKLQNRMRTFDKKLDVIGEDVQNILKQNKSVLELRRDLQKKNTDLK